MESKCPSVGEWITKLWHIPAKEYYPALKRNEPASHGGNLCILLNERSQSEKAT